MIVKKTADVGAISELRGGESVAGSRRQRRLAAQGMQARAGPRWWTAAARALGALCSVSLKSRRAVVVRRARVMSTR